MERKLNTINGATLLGRGQKILPLGRASRALGRLWRSWHKKLRAVARTH